MSGGAASEGAASEGAGVADGAGEPGPGAPEAPVESAVIVPVLQADALLRPFRDRWDPPAPVGIPAAVVLAYPFLLPDELGPETLRGLAAIFGACAPIDARLAGVMRRPGAVHLEVDPQEPFAALADEVAAAFPASRAPRDGSLIPHITALRSHDDHALDATASELAPLLPRSVAVAEAWLVQAAGAKRAWLVAGAGERWTLRMRFPLGVSRY